MKQSAHIHSPLLRRDAIRVGFCAALGIGIPDILRYEAEAAISAASAAPGTFTEGKAKSVIHLHLPGGMSHQESWDPKPEAPAEYRGALGVVKTKGGEVFSENFVKLAAVADKINVIRSIVGKIPDHQLATYQVFTAYTPTTVLDYPQMGAVVSHLFGPRNGLPPYVAVPRLNGYEGGTGFLSSKYGAFQLNADPGANGPFKVRDFSIPNGVSLEQFERRKTARDIVEQHMRRLEADPDKLNTMDEFNKSAYSLLTSEKSRKAFSLDGETDKTRELYGKGQKLKNGQPSAIAERLLLARRLVEAGVRFVTVSYGSWDAHTAIKDISNSQMPPLDQAIAGLITDLDERGMLDSTLVMVTTEFGRTPKINAGNGRDHWARCYSMLIAGGGTTRGQIYGASDSTAAEPARDAVPVEDYLATAYHQLGIDSTRKLLAMGTRPVEIGGGGKVVSALLG